MCSLYDRLFGHLVTFVPSHGPPTEKSSFFSSANCTSSSHQCLPFRSNWTGDESVSFCYTCHQSDLSLKPSAKSIDIAFLFSICQCFFTRFFNVHSQTGDTSSASDELTRHSACTIKCSTNGLIMLMAKVRVVILLSLMLFVPSNVTASADVSEIRNGTLFTVTSIRINTATARETNQLQGMCSR